MSRRVQHFLNQVRTPQLNSNTTLPSILDSTEDRPIEQVRQCVVQNLFNSQSVISSSDRDLFSDQTLNSDSESLEDLEPVSNSTLSQCLREWTITYNITHAALRGLLNILPPFLHTETRLPSDPRTLMQTPRNLELISISGGHYVHFNLFKNLRKKLCTGIDISITKLIPILKKMQDSLEYPLISISIGIDGIPASRSNNTQFWPILAKIDQTVDRSPFVVGIFYGNSKPTDLEFMKYFIKEFADLELNGIDFLNVKYSVRLSSIIADAPARSFIKCIKNHNSYNSCERCTVHGEWLGRVIYPIENSELRSDSSFYNQTDPDHHVGVSIITNLKVGPISQIPLDYMHMICLGVVRKLVRQWVKGKLSNRLPNRDKKLISNRLLLFRKSFPSNFQRKPRSLWEIDHYKASELRTILLYTGVLAFKDIIPKSNYKNFLLIHSAMFILLSDKASHKEWNKLAKELLHEFVAGVEKIYGSEFLIYNIHSLIHIPDDSLNYGSLNTISAFPFENHMQKIKKFMHSGNFKLEQVANRISELECSNSHNKIVSKSDYLNRKTFKMGDNCFYLKNGTIIIVLNRILNNNSTNFTCKRFKKIQKLKNYPFDSMNVGIVQVADLSDEEVISLSCSDIMYKCVLLKHIDYDVCIPMLHSAID